MVQSKKAAVPSSKICILTWGYMKYANESDFFFGGYTPHPEYLALVRGIIEKRQKCFGTPDRIPNFIESQIREVPPDRMDWEHHGSGISSSNTSDLYLQIKVTPLCPSFNLDRIQGVGGVGLVEKAVSRQGQCPQCAAGQPVSLHTHCMFRISKTSWQQYHLLSLLAYNSSPAANNRNPNLPLHITLADLGSHQSYGEMISAAFSTVTMLN